MEKAYVEIVRLLLAATPEVFRAPCFALKGGTALNLFVQEMLRFTMTRILAFSRCVLRDEI